MVYNHYFLALSFFFFFFIGSTCTIYIYIYMYIIMRFFKKIKIWRLRVAILMVPCVTDVEIRQFWMKNLIEVPSSYFPITQVTIYGKKKN
jgi:hypothetical protein